MLNTEKTRPLSVTALLLTFVFFGISENIKGPALPYIQADYGINELQVGYLLSINALGFLLACMLANLLIQKIEVKAVLLIALIVMTLAGLLIFGSARYGQFSASYFVMYFGNGLLEIVLSIIAARMFQQNTVFMMGLCHFSFGMGSTLGPLGAAQLIGWPVGGEAMTWQGMYAIMLGLGIVPILLVAISSFPKQIRHEAVARLSFREHLRDPILWLLAGIITFSVIVELSIAGWLVNLMEKAYGWSSGSAAGLLAAFFFVFMISRLALSPLIERMGYAKSMMLFSALCGLCCIAGAALGSSFFVLFVLAGLGVAPLYPTVMACVTKLYPGNTDGAVNFIIVVWAIGSMGGNVAVGGLTTAFKDWASAWLGQERGQVLGLELGFMFIGLLALIGAYMSWMLLRKMRSMETVRSY
ncbi:Fucose permease [Paenibacillus sp. UNCCL117]|uniref:MFS transporter n=1 Tax=unclassified Paenibacillus TaxID=185978 RepID=UPI000882F37C|nr:MULTISPECIES: MFS transporter [unclassified Paenibacillus]SDD57494.1 Fucose permease [Paenibacillus sp. cl123]SFW51173.1 Fucose permease [Paenibacillus sp. UNCCL117]